jgi:hypothetical protein
MFTSIANLFGNLNPSHTAMIQHGPKIVTVFGLPYLGTRMYPILGEQGGCLTLK